MKKIKSWYLKRRDEVFIKLAKQNGLRSRAWYKIREINNRYNLFKKEFNILDIGCSPGGWSQYIISKIGDGKLICFDKIEMKHMSNIIFFQADLNDINNIYKKIISILKGDKFNVIVSDICHKLSGIRIIDMNNHLKNLYNLAYLCKLFLLKNGSFVAKIFNGEEFKQYIIDIKKSYKDIYLFKPQSSLASSKELYIIAKNYI